MSDFKYFKRDRSFNELYYQFPKVLLVSEKYKSLSDSCKISYMLLKARLELAIYRNQIDEEGNVFFSFTQKELAEILNCHSQKVKDILKSLAKYDLLKIESQGYNKTLKKKNPNRLYLAELDVTENDIYSLKAMDQNNDEMFENVDLAHGVKITPSPQNENTNENTDMTHGVKITPRENVDLAHGVKITQVLNNKPKTLNTKETKRNGDGSQQEKDPLLEGFANNMIKTNQTFLPLKAVSYIEIYSKTVEEAYNMMKKIHHAKANAEKLEKTPFSYEVIKLDSNIDIDQKITNTVMNVYIAQKTRKVDSLEGLMFSWATNCFQEVIREYGNLSGKRGIPDQ